MATGYWAMLARQPDLRDSAASWIGAFQAAKESKERKAMRDLQMEGAKLELEQRRTENERQQILPEARASYAQGRPQMLQEIAPDEAQKMAAGQERRQDVEAQRLANVQRYVAQGMQSGAMSPQQAQSIMQRYGGGADLGPFGVQQRQPDPAELEAQASARLGPPQMAKPERWNNPIAEEVVYIDRIPREDPRFPQAYERRKAAADQAAVARARASQAPKDIAGDLRREFQSQQTVRDTQTVAAAYQKIKNTSDTGPGDLSLLYAYMKLVDPGSVVRESEFATAAQTGSLPQRIQGWATRVINGEKLPPQVREQFRTEADAIFSAQRQRYGAVAKQYSRLAQQAGASPADVVLDPGFDQQQRPAPQQPVTRTDPETGETRVWDGQAWVRE